MNELNFFILKKVSVFDILLFVLLSFLKHLVQTFKVEHQKILYKFYYFFYLLENFKNYKNFINIFFL